MKMFALVIGALCLAGTSIAQSPGGFSYRNSVGANSSFLGTNIQGVVKTPPYKSGYSYPALAFENTAGTGSNGYVSGTIYYSPLLVNNRVTITSITTRITVPTTSASMVVGIYAADQATSSPTTLLTTSNVQNINTNAYITFTLSPSVTVEPNTTYYIGALADGGTTMPSIWINNIANCVSFFRGRVGGFTPSQLLTTGGCGFIGTGATLLTGLSSTVPVSTLSLANGTFGTPAFTFQVP
ncbi:hypothetical protein EBZ38_03780 [bacterium]|nr:hypothetical protein [bacterium]